ncbi:hypothetical protein J3F84DRAFT_406229 [Trichoderma pleuroticola]
MSNNPKWLSAPPSAQTVTVRLIEEVGMMSLPSALFLDPVSEGHEVMNGCDLAFLIENKDLGKMAVFDLGVRKDCISLNDINDVIWSHSHLDHRGDVSLFPPSTTLNYGKEVAALKPGVTSEAEAVFLATDFAERHNNEIDFGKSTFKIGGFPALDFYGDGSFYLLDTPGHDHGHLSALARTTSTAAGHDKDTFILLAGDACHLCGMLRPIASHPFPDRHFPDSSIGLSGIESLEMLKRHPQFPQSSDALNEAARVTPWYGVATGQLSTFVDPIVGQNTANKVRDAFDEIDNVFVAVCHDLGLLVQDNGKPVLPSLNKAPQEDLNSWYEKGWKDKVYWTWVNELGKKDEHGRVQPQESAVIGFWMHGKRYDKAQDVFEEACKSQDSLKA